MQGITSIDYLYCFYYINTYLSGGAQTYYIKIPDNLQELHLQKNCW